MKKRLTLLKESDIMLKLSGGKARGVYIMRRSAAW